MARQRGDDVENLVLRLDPDSPRYRSAVVGLNVRRARRELGWNQSRLAARLTDHGWTTDQGMVSALETDGHHRGRRGVRVSVTVDRLDLLARVLGVEMGWLLDDAWATSIRQLHALAADSGLTVHVTVEGEERG